MRFKSILFYFIAFFSFQFSIAQTSGDYRSIATGDWSIATNWETYNGTSWVAASQAPNSSNGIISIRSGDSIQLSIATTVDQVNIESGGVLSLENTSFITVFTLNDAPGTDISVNGKLYISTNATLDGSGTIQTSGGGIFTINNGGNLFVNTTNNGTMNINNGANINNATISNNGTFALLDSTVNLNTSTLLNNSLISLPSTSNCYFTTGNSLDTGFVTNTSSGIIFKTNASGIAEFSSTIKLINNGTVKGVGEYIFANTITNTGTISPGDNSTAIMIVNPSFITGKTPTLVIEINSVGGIVATNYDQLQISDYNFSTVNFSGVTLNLIENAVDVVGTEYTIISDVMPTSTILGPFGTNNAPSNFGNVNFAGNYVTIKKLFQSITWDGGAGTSNWNDANNWNPNIVPRPADNVSISTTTSVLINTAAVCRDFTLNNASLIVSIQTGNSLIVNGDLTLTNGQLNINGQSLVLNGTVVASGSGTITGSATSALTIGGTDGGNFGTINMTTGSTNNYIGNFTLSRTGLNGSVSIGSNGLVLAGIMTLSNGTLNTGGNLTLHSSSIPLTGCIAPINNGAGINGLVTVERFLTQGNRAYCDLTPTTNSTTTIFNSWQEAGNNNNGYGIQITGSAGTVGTIDATTGFDRTSTGNKSMYSMNISNVTGNSSWDAITSTNQTNDTLSAFKAYRLLVRGNRQNNLSQDNPLMNAATVVRSKGTLITGTVTYTTTGVTANGGTNNNIRLNSGDPLGYSMIGNPYPSPIDWETILANSNNLDSSYWVFDPNMASYGAYVTYNADLHMNSNNASEVNRFIQPGGGFFIQNKNSTAPTLLIQESDKATSSANLMNVFRAATTAPSRMYFTLSKQVGTDTLTMDGCSVGFSNAFNNTMGSEKFTNTSDNLAINNYGKFLSINGRKMPTVNDTIVLNISEVTAGINYKLKINLAYLVVNGMQPILLDRFTNTQTLLPVGNNNYVYAFTTTSDTMSFKNRFRVVFSTSVLPITFNSIKAYKKDNEAEVSWSSYENNAAYYEVEHSSTANNFTKIAAVQATNSSASNLANYIWHHAKTPLGINYYRIKSVDKSGLIQYSNTVSVSINKAATLVVYPNPIKGNNFTIDYADVVKENFTVELFNTNGQRVFTDAVASNGSSTNTISFKNNKPKAGNYLLIITTETGKKTSTQIIVQ